MKTVFNDRNPLRLKDLEIDLRDFIPQVTRVLTALAVDAPEPESLLETVLALGRWKRTLDGSEIEGWHRAQA